MLLNKSYDVAVFAARPAPIALPARIDVEARSMVIMERAKALIGGAGRTQGNIAANHINDVVGVFDLLGQGYPVARQGPPVWQEKNREPARSAVCCGAAQWAVESWRRRKAKVMSPGRWEADAFSPTRLLPAKKRIPTERAAIREVVRSRRSVPRRRSWVLSLFAVLDQRERSGALLFSGRNGKRKCNRLGYLFQRCWVGLGEL